MNLTSTRQAIHDALTWGYMQMGGNGLQEYLIYLTRIEKSIRNREQCVDFLEAAYICAAVNVLSPHLGGWLKFAYGEETSGLVQDCLADKLRRLFPIGSLKKNERIFALAQTSLEDYRLRIWRSRDMPVVVYCDRMSVQQPNFYRDGWGDKQNTCLDEIKFWDAEGVGQVSRMVKALRGDDDYQRPTEVLEALANDKV